MKAHPMLVVFPAYLEDYRRLEEAYYRIPSWRTIKQLQNIKQRERLTKNYMKHMKDWGLIQ